MLKKFLSLLFLMIPIKLICMESRESEVIPYYETMPIEVMREIMGKYLETVVDSISLPIGESSLTGFQAEFKNLILKARLLNRATNIRILDLKFYTISLLIKKFNRLSQNQKIDCLNLFFDHNKTELVAITLLSFLDLTTIPEKERNNYIKSRFVLLYTSLKKQTIYQSPIDKNFVLKVSKPIPELFALLVEIQNNVSDRSLFDIEEWFKKCLRNRDKTFLKILLHNYNKLSFFTEAPLTLAAARGDIQEIVRLSKRLQEEIVWDFNAAHWAIIGNSDNCLELLDLLLSDNDIKELSLQDLQFMITLAIDWSDATILDYLLSRFQNHCSFSTFKNIIDDFPFPKSSMYFSNIPLFQAISSYNNDQREDMIVTLINYGADITCIMYYVSSIEATQSPLINKLLETKRYIAKVQKKLLQKKQQNDSQLLTKEDIIDVCNQVKIRKNITITTPITFSLIDSSATNTTPDILTDVTPTPSKTRATSKSSTSSLKSAPEKKKYTKPFVRKATPITPILRTTHLSSWNDLEADYLSHNPINIPQEDLPEDKKSFKKFIFMAGIATCGTLAYYLLFNQNNPQNNIIAS